MKVCLAQIEIVSGDIAGNAKKIIDAILEQQDEADIIVFPELAITGYNCGQLFEMDEFFEDSQSAFDQIVQACTGKAQVLLGTIRLADNPREIDNSIRIHNSVARVHKGVVHDVYDKTHLANSYQHEDRKYFIPNEKGHQMVFALDGEKCGVLICEDIWSENHYEDLIYNLKRHHDDLKHLFVLNYSYFTLEKHDVRAKLSGDLCAKHDISIHYCNAVGIGDIVKNIMVYDGSSFYCRRRGLVKCAQRFQPDMFLYDTNVPFDLHEALNQINESVDSYHSKMRTFIANTPERSDSLFRQRKCLYYASKNELILEATTYALRSMLALIGISKVQIHMSGGIDSAVIACIASIAVGNENCVFITNPSLHNSDTTKGLAQEVVDKLGVISGKSSKLIFQPIQGLSTGAEESLEQSDDQGACTPMELTTLHAVGRTAIALAATHRYGSVVLPSGNHTENILGWFNFHDIGSIGLIQLIGDLSKSELFSFADWLNMIWFGTEVINPKIILTSPADKDSILPMAELPDSTVDPFDYKLMSCICIAIIRGQMTPSSLMRAYLSQTLPNAFFADYEIDHSKAMYDQIAPEVFASAVDEAWSRANIAVYKCAQSAPVLMLSKRSRGFSARETILCKYKPRTATDVLLHSTHESTNSVN